MSSRILAPIVQMWATVATKKTQLHRVSHQLPTPTLGLLPACSYAPFYPPSHCRRSYHSVDHPTELPQDDRFSHSEQSILAAAYHHIPEHGFSERTLALGACDAGYPTISTSILHGGVFSLIRWHFVTQRHALAARSCGISSITAHGINSRVSKHDIASRAERLTWERLLGNRTVAPRWQEALVIMTQPNFIAASLRELALLVDEIWALAGDNSTDSSWYSKRVSLSSIYVASELFMTTDSDPELTATREFLHRRFRESFEVAGYLSAAGNWAGFAVTASANVLRSKGALL